MAGFPDCELWDFSLAVYGRTGVAEACLGLQERHRVDVNLLLFCCWHGASGRGVLDAARLAQAQQAVAPWHDETVRVLRSVRVRLKRAPDSAPLGLAIHLRKRIGAVEIEAEHIEQLILAGLALPPTWSIPPADERVRSAARNARRYIGALANRLGIQDQADLFTVLAGCFPELARVELRTLLEAADS